MEDYYSKLGVTRQADGDAIKKAYRQLAKTHHPDHGGDHDAFSQITQAYNTLKDQTSKTQYDRSLGKKTIRPRQRRTPLRLRVDVDFADVVLGASKILSVTHGDEVFDLAFTLPTKISTGDVIRLTGAADDIFVEFNVLPHPEIRRVGDDLVMTKQLTFWDLLLGTSVDITTIEGVSLTLNVPAHTPPGRTFRFKNLGVASTTAARGNLLVEVEAVLPKPLTEALRSAILNEIHKEEQNDAES